MIRRNAQGVEVIEAGPIEFIVVPNADGATPLEMVDAHLAMCNVTQVDRIDALLDARTIYAMVERERPDLERCQNCGDLITEVKYTRPRWVHTHQAVTHCWRHDQRAIARKFTATPREITP
jgi:hypothetical protein